MDVNLLAKFVELMASADLNTVDVRDGDRRVILKRGAAVGGPVHVTQVAPPVSASAPTGPNPAAAEQPSGNDEAGYLRITSPMVGTFYAAPKPGEKPFVSVGSRVNEDTDVCIIEAMKTFNNIKAECSGTIARILVQDGQPVEFGTILFLVKPE
jgi:acetyl-CoA carboxylase biotin carboxyl carrier protein